MTRTGKVQLTSTGKRLLLPSGKAGVMINEDDCCPCESPTCSGTIEFDPDTCLLTWSSSEDVEAVEIRHVSGLDVTVVADSLSGTLYTRPRTGTFKLFLMCEGDWVEYDSVYVSATCTDTCCEALDGTTVTVTATGNGLTAISATTLSEPGCAVTAAEDDDTTLTYSCDATHPGLGTIKWYIRRKEVYGSVSFSTSGGDSTTTVFGGTAILTEFHRWNGVNWVKYDNGPTVQVLAIKEYDGCVSSGSVSSSDIDVIWAYGGDPWEQAVVDAIGAMGLAVSFS